MATLNGTSVVTCSYLIMKQCLVGLLGTISKVPHTHYFTIVSSLHTLPIKPGSIKKELEDVVFILKVSIMFERIT